MKLLKLFLAFWGIVFIFWGLLTILFDVFYPKYGVIPLNRTHSLFLLLFCVLYTAITLLYKNHLFFAKKTLPFIFVLVICCLFGLFAYFQCYPLTQFPQYLAGISKLKIKYLIYNTPALWLFLGHSCISFIILKKKMGDGSATIR